MNLGRTRAWLTGPLTLFVAAACAPRPPGPPAPQSVFLDTLSMRAHTFFLAHDLLQGRGTGTHGSAIAALYLEAQCRARGLLPVGTEYSHPVPLDEAIPHPGVTQLRIGAHTFAFGRDFLIVGGTEQSLRGFAGPTVFVGTADDVRTNIGAVPSLDGAVAVLRGVARADVARLLIDRGAVALLQVVADPMAYAGYLVSRGLTLTILRDPDVPSSFHAAVPSLLVGPSVAEVLRLGPAPAELVAAFERRPLSAHNVACLLPGSDRARRDSAIVLSAHYDHLGVSLPDAAGDSVYNGFSDNAAGVAMLLAIADALRAEPAGGPRHSVLFLFFTAEEPGLLGSDYFVAHPIYPLGRMRALINLDAGAPPAAPWAWEVVGDKDSPLGHLARDVAATRGWTVTFSAPRGNSDYFPFALAGVPAVFLIPGSAPYQGLSADSSQALRRRWDRYHLPSDRYEDAFPFSGLRRNAEFALLLAEAIDAQP